MKIFTFILYDNRSGSTLFSALLNQYEGVCVSIETDLVYQILEYERNIQTKKEKNIFLDYLFDKTRFWELQIDRNKAANAIENVKLSKGELLSALLKLYFHQNDPDAEFYIVKGPRIYYHMADLLKYFPEASFIQLIRDGRAVYHSKTKTSSIRYIDGSYVDRGPMNKNILHAAMLWRKKLRIADSFRQHVMDIRYEDLITDADSTIAKTLNYIKVSMEKRKKIKRKDSYLSNMRKEYHALHANVGDQPRCDLIEKWKENLLPQEICLYELITCPYLKRHAYTLMYADKVDLKIVFGVIKLILLQAIDLLRKFVFTVIDRHH